MDPLLTPPSLRLRIHRPLGPSSQIVLPTPSADANVAVDFQHWCLISCILHVR